MQLRHLNKTMRWLDWLHVSHIRVPHLLQLSRLLKLVLEQLLDQSDMNSKVMKENNVNGSAKKIIISYSRFGQTQDPGGCEKTITCKEKNAFKLNQMVIS